MNIAMLMSKFISTKTTMPLRSNCGLTTLEFAALIKPRMTGGQCSVPEHIHKPLDAKFRGSLVNHGSLKETGNCLMDSSKK